ncbi:MAG TPA: hypothetical protein VLV86_00600 [Vicinamibacterales bacterium]|nr:hypothetical protein [Vicinamibacterales bacterium]
MMGMSQMLRMSRMSRVLVAAAAMTICSAGVAFAADQTWTGTISDSRCGASHKAMTEHNKNLTDRSCTEACVKGGATYVLASGNKVYKLENQKDPALATYAGEAVTVTGDLHGDTITATRITKS